MEIQFSIPLKVSRIGSESGSGGSGNPTQKRHVKCDETKPSCLNCMKWRGYCDGYNEAADAQSTRSETPAVSNLEPTNQKHNAKLIHTKKAPLILSEPTVNTHYFENSEQRAYFDEWSYLSVGFLSGGLGESTLWTATMPQLTLQETTLRYGAMAVGALRKACDAESEAKSPTPDLMNGNKHYLNAIIYYCEALRLQSKAKPTKEGLRTAMLSSLLFICFETQRGNMPAALKHVTHGFSMLNELSACTEKAPDLVSIAPAPPALVQEILECYKPLELQSRSFMGSYKKFFFFPPRPQPPTSSHDPSDASQSSTPVAPLASSSPSQPGSPWRASSGTQQTPTGLPSPQSQDSPPSQVDRPSPRGPPQGHPGGPLQRPPHIAPFTKHSPYFKPKQSNIKLLEEMPAAFTTFDEANGYWSLLQRQMVQYIPVLTGTTNQLALSKITDISELEQKLASVRKNPKIAKFVDESRYWLQRWSQSFDPMYQAAVANRANNMSPYLQALNLRVEYLILYIYTAIPRYAGIENSRALTPQYQEINVLAEVLISNRPNCGFSMDSGWTWPLFVSSFGCRDPSVRDEAIRILGQYPIRNALRDSRIFRAIALKNREVEAMATMEGDEDEQWLRLRRRELVFEDLGSNIIFRSAQKSPVTGEWELVEESAAFMVGADGNLDWHRQPISDSASILSGVC
ncbi:hypothetical protein G7046_g3697 [Stylonectria norvegica]|nr:hypothetical protein G7046_g3697 [Stylonectria norvegica]